MKKVAAYGPTLNGMDISHFQAGFDFNKITNEQFVFMKATEGIGYVDPNFKQFWQRAHTQGMIKGAYHFFRPDQDPQAQARHFVDTVGVLNKGDLPMSMDWEVTDNVPSAQDLVNGSIFLKLVEALTGMVPIICTGPYFFEVLKAPSMFAKYPLWIMHHGTDKPLVPDPFSTWTFHQYTDKLNVGGKSCDGDVFNGDAAALAAFIQRCTLSYQG